MSDIKRIIQKAQDDVFPQLEAKIREALAQKDKAWLIDQIIYLTYERHSLEFQRQALNGMRERIQRIVKTAYTLNLYCF